MTIPSFLKPWQAGEAGTPKIYILEVRKPDNTEAGPVAWLLVERQETVRYDERDNSVFEATIELAFMPIRSKYKRDDPFRASFTASYHTIGSDGPWISLTSHSYGHGAVFLDPPELRGHRIGTFLMNEIVLWAKQWPTAAVNSIELLEGQAYNGNRARRNRLYEQFGLTFDYRDSRNREGLSKPIVADLLRPVDTWKANLRVVKVDAFLGDLLNERRELVDKTKQQQTAIADLMHELGRARNHPVWWAIQKLWKRHCIFVAAVVIIAGLVALSWSN